jgi:DNA-binding phage protein
MLSDEDDADNEEDEDKDKEDADTDAEDEDEDEDEHEDEDAEDEDEDAEDEDEDEDEEKKASKIMKKKMKKEEKEWLGSLLNQIGDPTQKFDSGFTEDNFSADEAGPGEVGYAPSGRIADNFTQVTEAKGLTEKQKKQLPEALQKAILKKQGVKSDEDSDEKSDDSEKTNDKSDEDSEKASDKESDEGSKGSVEKHLKACFKKNPKASFKEAKDYVKKQKGMEKSKVTLKDYLVCKKKAK